MRKLLAHVELVLTFAGLIIVLGAHRWSSLSSDDPWMFTAIAATSVGVLHGLIFWLIRQRQRTVRDRLVSQSVDLLSATWKSNEAEAEQARPDGASRSSALALLRSLEKIREEPLTMPSLEGVRELRSNQQGEISGNS